MTDRNTISQVIESLFEDWIDKNRNVHPLTFQNMKLLEADALELLKEQEAVKPKSKVRHGETCQYQHWCGNCMVMLHGKPKYCPNCGRAVKWE